MIKQFEQNGMNQEISRTVAPLISNSKAIARISKLFATVH